MVERAFQVKRGKWCGLGRGRVAGGGRGHVIKGLTYQSEVLLNFLGGGGATGKFQCGGLECLKQCFRKNILETTCQLN